MPRPLTRERPLRLRFPTEFHDAMVAHCVREAPLECCGLLGGIAPVVSSFHPLRNASASEVRYDADPRDLIEAVQSLRARRRGDPGDLPLASALGGDPEQDRPGREPLRRRPPDHRLAAGRDARGPGLAARSGLL